MIVLDEIDAAEREGVDERPSPDDRPCGLIATQVIARVGAGEPAQAGEAETGTGKTAASVGGRRKSS